MSEYEGIWTNQHDDHACYLLKTYNLQAYYANGNPRPARDMNTLEWYAKQFGYTTKQLKEHWRCIENERHFKG
jgi:hypothetical protein